MSKVSTQHHNKHQCNNGYNKGQAQQEGDVDIDRKKQLIVPPISTPTIYHRPAADAPFVKPPQSTFAVVYSRLIDIGWPDKQRQGYQQSREQKKSSTPRRWI